MGGGLGGGEVLLRPVPTYAGGVGARYGHLTAHLSPPPLGVPTRVRAAAPLRLWPNPAAAHVQGGSGPATVRDALGRLVAMVPPHPLTPRSIYSLRCAACPPGST